jgi:hypothetical protein
LVIGVRREGENCSIGSQAKEPIEGNRGDIHVGLRYLPTSESRVRWLDGTPRGSRPRGA